MATVTKNLGFFPFDATTSATLELDYDDVTLAPLLVRCINTSGSTFTATATSTKGNHIGQQASHTFAASQTSVVNLPSGAVNRWGVTVTAQGRIDGIEISTRWGA